jgi:hypothetical protein
MTKYKNADITQDTLTLIAKNLDRTQLDNNRIDTTQGVNMTKSLIATELANAINTIIPTNNITSSQQQARVVVDNQAFCSGMGTTGAACAFTIGIQK